MERSVLLLLVAALPAAIGWLFPGHFLEDYKGDRMDCCKTYNGSKCGGAFGRGNCLATSAPTPGLDFRANPMVFFCVAKCKCNGNFEGPNCGDCIAGFTGVDCTTPTMVLRRNFTSMNETERTRFLCSWYYCSFKIDPMWVVLEEGNRLDNKTFVFRSVSFIDVFKYIHQCTSGSWISNGIVGSSPSMAHGGPAFHPWHRRMLMMVERTMQRCMKDPSFGMVYLDLSMQQFFTDDYLCDTDASGRFHTQCIFSNVRGFCSGFDYDGTRCLMPTCYWERPEIHRQAGMNPDQPNMPTAADMEACIKNSTYSTMRICMEGVHNNVHNFISGDMLSTRTATNDPLFYMYHAYIDNCYERGIRLNGFTPASYPNGSYSFGHNRGDCAACMRECYTHPSVIVPCSKLGYKYENIPEPSAPAG